MIKFFGLIPRRPDLSPEEFHDHYRHPHGTLGKRIPRFRGYVQSHQTPSRFLGDDQTRFEAVAEVWFDTVSDAVGLAEDAHYVAHVQPDEPNFVDLDNLRWLYATEEVLRSGPDQEPDAPLADRLLDGMHLERPVTVKLLHFAAARAGSEDRTSAASRLGAGRHVRCAPHAEIHAEEPPAFAAVHELWWPTVWDFERAAEANRGALSDLTERDDGSVTVLAYAERFI
jgi:uncharacterized protein (TIGR02118 family)